MVKLSDFLKILDFQLRRDVYYLMRVSLELLEKDRDFGLKLEKLLDHAGFIDNELFKSAENFEEARKKILNEYNNRVREIESLIKQFNIDSGGK
jgi:uncharacterized coiled-coil DUF342 family protein